jgi:hypothetical protein
VVGAQRTAYGPGAVQHAFHPRLLICAVLCAAGLVACGRSALPEAPAEVVKQFLEAMKHSAEDESALVEAYGLLDQNAQRALAARATRTRALSGQAYEPWQMLAQGRFRLHFEARGAMRERIDGERAVVVVSGAHDKRAEVPLVREQGRWRIQLVLPPMRSDVPGRQSDG